MYCQNCGQEVNDNAVVCVHCGCSVKTEETKSVTTANGISINTVGVLLGLFLGLIGLVIGILLYKDDAKQVFIKGWVKGFVIGIVASVLLGIVSSCSWFLIYEFL
ncbi:MAG: zinc ribbon domain-containing protein [Clostridia bacterium]|nr:zinc ribbon domain-containing protein [Clostridia bacterium]